MHKQMFFLAFFFAAVSGLSQNLQLHYDLRHTVDPKTAAANFVTFSFEYFKLIDTAGTGSFLLKVQADMNGTKNNISQVFTQVSQSLRFWKPPVYLYFNYSGGLGVTPSSFGFYIANSYGIGVSYPFQWKGAWLAANLSVRYNAFAKPSYDPQFTFYFGKGISNYRFFTAGSFVFWTENRNQGNEHTQHLKGKKFAFFGDPQFWIRIKGGLSAGTRVNVFYHIFKSDNVIQLYPTVGVKYQF
ncbi:DUF5020 family protein [Foetidibacter luteolus]|uniref:DUF5020 family protein n=1 Tax=Foetidibacter luteolus TaxID=2608880 RepID=UPI00129BA1A3|nr:DUF5020 family protein [Foetidibacter luteolus]